MDPSKKRSRGEEKNDLPTLEGLAEPNFEELASRFRDFRVAWKEVAQAQSDAKTRGDRHYSLAACSTHKFSMALSKALLHVHFNINLPFVSEHHLCPPVPNRFFYVRWIQTTLLPTLTGNQPNGRSCFKDAWDCSGLFLDIGTGASCVYPLLFAASCRQQGVAELKRFFATEVDLESVHLATQNVLANPFLSAAIQVLRVDPSSSQQGSSSPILERGRGPLTGSLERLPDGGRRIDVMMTNPPFYEPNENITERRADGRQRAAMTVSEGTYPGGEIGFVMDMLFDGIMLFAGDATHSPPPAWSSSMCGRKTSWLELTNTLEQLLGYSHVVTTEYGPGYMTRWFVAWTFLRPDIRSPLSRQDSWNFMVEVVNEESTSTSSLIEEVASRIGVYCKETVRGHHLDILWDTSQVMNGEAQAIIMEMDQSTGQGTNQTWMGDETLPKQLHDILKTRLTPDKRRALLPVQGHFQVDLAIRTVDGASVSVKAHAFAHTRYGKRIAEKIKQQMAGEVCRTTRKWRRRRQRLESEARKDPDSMAT